MNCDQLKTHLYDYSEQNLSEEQRAAVDRHAAECPDCAEVMKTAAELTCQELADFLHEYVDDALPAERKAVFERHLNMCPPCVDFLENYKRTIKLTEDACGPCDDDAPEVPPALVQAILAARKRST